MKLSIIIARILSTLFRPLYYPALSVLILLYTTYLSILPWNYKLHLLAFVVLFTIALPAITIWFYRTLSHIKRHEMKDRENRIMSYFITLCYYIFFLYLTDDVAMPRFVRVIVILFLAIQIVSLIINLKWKVSMHAAGSGGIIGLLAAFSFSLNFNPVWYLCTALLFSGLIMTSRLLLRMHSLSGVLVGMLLGVLCGFWGVLLFY